MKYLLPTTVVFLTLLLFSQVSVAETKWVKGNGVTHEWSKLRWLKASAKLHYDTVNFSDDVTALKDDSDFRRARFGVQVNMDDWRARADYDFGVSEGWKLLYLQYRGFDRTRVTAGNHLAPMSMEDLTGSNNLIIPERSLASALSPGLLTGVSIGTRGDHWTLRGGYFGDELSDLDRRRLQGKSVVVRGTFAPVATKGKTLHFGASFESRDVDTNKGVRIRTRPESRVTDVRLIDTRVLNDVDQATTYGLEFAASYNWLAVQAEHLNMSLDRELTADADLTGNYVAIIAALTGERIRYRRGSGTFVGVRPKSNWGALMLSVRRSMLDLDDAPVLGGEQTQQSIGLAWLLSDQFSVHLTYSDYEAAPNRNNIDEDGLGHSECDCNFSHAHLVRRKRLVCPIVGNGVDHSRLK
ncbi:MAG: hypothetical protein GXP16_15750 [Gammaproteobacteria bacterium]|nr:hypothetical protein [Gammaproteobacteria bacterium]